MVEYIMLDVLKKVVSRKKKYMTSDEADNYGR